MRVRWQFELIKLNWSKRQRVFKNPIFIYKLLHSRYSKKDILASNKSTKVTDLTGKYVAIKNKATEGRYYFMAGGKGSDLQ